MAKNYGKRLFTLEETGMADKHWFMVSNKESMSCWIFELRCIFTDKHRLGQIKAAALNKFSQFSIGKRKLEGKCKAMCFYICEIKAIYKMGEKNEKTAS